MTSKANFGSAIRAARKSKGLTQEDFSVISSRTYLSSLERGIKSPTLEKIDHLASVLNIHPVSLVALAYLAGKSGQVRDKDVGDLFKRVTKEVLDIQIASSVYKE